MNFKDYIISKQKLVIGWMVISGVALFTNLTAIEGNVYNDDYNTKFITVSSAYEDPYLYASEHCNITINIFTSTVASPDAQWYRARQQSFWPFVSFYKNYDYFPMYGLNRIGGAYRIHQKKFFGVFYMFDFSEFIAYQVLLFFGLYFFWRKRHKQKNSN